jgi:chaperonin GroEL
VEEGIVPGGGVALLRTMTALEKARKKGDEGVGMDIVRRSLEFPIRQIAQNAGVDGSIVCERVKGEKGGFGFNALTGQYGDLVEQGVFDPTKVVRCALQNAASIAGLLLTTEALVSEIKEKKPRMPGGGGRGGMGGMGGMGGEDMY